MFSNFKIKIKNWLEKLRALPDNQKKIILWLIVGVVGIGMLFFWIKSTLNTFSNIEKNIGEMDFLKINTTENSDFSTNQDFETKNYSVKLYIWPDKDSFNLQNRTFYATDLDSKNLIKIKVLEDAKIYKKISKDKIEYYDFQWLYSTLKNWEGPNWQFTVIGILQEDGSILSSEIYYQLQ